MLPLRPPSQPRHRLRCPESDEVTRRVFRVIVLLEDELFRREDHLRQGMRGGRRGCRWCGRSPPAENASGTSAPLRSTGHEGCVGCRPPKLVADDVVALAVPKLLMADNAAPAARVGAVLLRRGSCGGGGTLAARGGQTGPPFLSYRGLTTRSSGCLHPLRHRSYCRRRSTHHRERGLESVGVWVAG